MRKKPSSLYCHACGLQTMTKMDMLNDVLVWTGQKRKTAYSDVQITAVQLFGIWKFIKEAKK